MWKKVPGFLTALDRSAASWNKRLASSPDEAQRQEWSVITGPIQTLISSEEFYIKQGCGSPRVFFESYVPP